MLNSIMALQALGRPDEDPLLQKAIRDFEGLFVDDPEDFRIQPCLSPVWDTAINMIALAESGLDPASEPLQSAARWMNTKEVHMRADWSKKNPASRSQRLGRLSSTTFFTRIQTTPRWCSSACAWSRQ